MPLSRRIRNGRKPARRAHHRAPHKGKGRKSQDSKVSGNQMARIRETVEFEDLTADAVTNFVFNLSQFQRASALAPSFKWYKAAKVEWNMDPLYNTFQDGPTAASVPYLYTVMNRTQDTAGLNVQDFQAMGAKPKKFVGQHKLTYKPNWCSQGIGLTLITSGSAGSVSSPVLATGLKQESAWLMSPDGNSGPNTTQSTSTAFYSPNPTPPGTLSPAPFRTITNQVVYNGHAIFVDQLLPVVGTNVPIARVTCTVTWLFKDPNCTYAAPPGVEAVPKISQPLAALAAPVAAPVSL